MSDIYLSLTETPSVVTLSQPVIASSVAATVTVGNTVTVALDANSLSALENVTVTVGAAVTIGNSVTIGSLPAISGTVTVGASSVTFNAYVGQRGDGTWSPLSLQTGSNYVNANVQNSVTIGSLPAISGTVTANVQDLVQQGFFNGESYKKGVVALGANYDNDELVPLGVDNFGRISGTVTAGNLPLVDDNFSSTTLGAIKANLYIQDLVGGSGLLPINNDGTSLPVEIWKDGSQLNTNNTLPISGTVTVGAVSTSVTVSQIQGTSVTTSNFTSTTASTTLVSANSARRGLTVFNEGAGNLHICVGATATTVAYQVRLSAGDYWECPAIQTSLTHSAQFASSGTARVVEIV